MAKGSNGAAKPARAPHPLKHIPGLKGVLNVLEKEVGDMDKFLNRTNDGLLDLVNGANRALAARIHFVRITKSTYTKWKRNENFRVDIWPHFNFLWGSARIEELRFCELRKRKENKLRSEGLLASSDQAIPTEKLMENLMSVSRTEDLRTWIESLMPKLRQNLLMETPVPWRLSLAEVFSIWYSSLLLYKSLKKSADSEEGPSCGTHALPGSVLGKLITAFGDVASLSRWVRQVFPDEDGKFFESLESESKIIEPDLQEYVPVLKALNIPECSLNYNFRDGRL